MKKLSLEEALVFLAKLMKDPEDEPAILMRGKKPIAAILPVGDADLEIVALSLSPKFHEIMERSRKREETEGGIPYEEVCRRLGHPLPRGYQVGVNGRGSEAKKRAKTGKSRRAKARA